MSGIPITLIWKRPKQDWVADMLVTILIVFLILSLIGTLPRWRHSANWGYFPSGGIGVLLTIILILWLMGRL